jgi:adenylate cyclase
MVVGGRRVRWLVESHLLLSGRGRSYPDAEEEVERRVGTEIERKFLVRDPSVLDGIPGVQYRQGYLSRDPDRTVRVRVAGDRGFLTVKGRSHGASRAEFEYEIPVADAELLLGLCEAPSIDKTRHLVAHGSHTWEVDVFHGANEGLVVAEVELGSPDELVDLPDWVGAEVTGDPRYYNANLVATPYRTW